MCDFAFMKALLPLLYDLSEDTDHDVQRKSDQI